MNLLKKKISSITPKNKWHKFCIKILIILFCIYIFGPYLLVYLGINIILHAKSVSKEGFIDLPVWHMLISDPLIWTGHHISSRGTLWMVGHGNDMEKKEALDILDQWPQKGAMSKLIFYASKEKNSDIRDRIIVAIGCCKDDKALPFLENLFKKGEKRIALIAMCKMQTILSEKKILEIYLNTKDLELKDDIWAFGIHSPQFTKTIILSENNLKIRLKAYWKYLSSKNEKFHEKNKEALYPLQEACFEWCYEDTFTPFDLIDTFKKHSELSLNDKKFLLLGHAVLRSPKSIPFLKKISTQNKSEPLRKLAKEILKVIPEK